jgi:hypothetical protein
MSSTIRLDAPPLDAARVSHVSHELRSPIAVISGYASLMLEDSAGPLSEAQRELVHRVFRSSTELERLLMDVVEYVRAVSDAVQPQPIEDVALAGVLAEAVELARLIASGKPLQVKEPTVAKHTMLSGERAAVRHAFLATASYLTRAANEGVFEVSVEASAERVRTVWHADQLRLPPDLETYLSDPLQSHPELKGHAAWLCGLAGARAHLARADGRLAIETGDGVRITLDLAAGRRSEASHEQPRTR